MDWDKIWSWVGIGVIVGLALFVTILGTKALIPSELKGYTILADSYEHAIPIYEVRKVVTNWPDSHVYASASFEEAFAVCQRLNHEAGTKLVEY